MSTNLSDLHEYIEKVNNAKKQNLLDLSSDQDLSIAVMNLISIEEHLFFTGAKTEKNGYYDIIEEIREMRKRLMQKLVKDTEGEIWCTSKHLLSAAMRLMEVGTKELATGRKESAYRLFSQSYQLYSLFWWLNLWLIGDLSGDSTLNTDNITSKDPAIVHTSSSHQAERSDTKLAEALSRAQGIEWPIPSMPQKMNHIDTPLPQSSLFSRLGKYVRDSVNCCRE